MEKWKESSSHRQITTVFIACSKTKRSWACPAQDLYQGVLFKKALRYAQLHYQSIYILSAKYGILHLDQLIEPYEKTLSKMSRKEKEEWYNKVRIQMREMKLNPPYLFLTGKLYNQPFKGIKPLDGMGIGRQLHWFCEKLRGIKTIC